MRRRGGPILPAVTAAMALLAATLPGTVVARDPEPLPVVSQVSAGQTHTCALWWSGLSCWGENEDGRLGNGTGSGSLAAPIAPPMVEPRSVVVPRPPDAVNVFAAVDAGTASTCAIASGQGDATAGTLWCWGDSSAPLGRVCVGRNLGGAQEPGMVMAGPPGPDGSETQCGTPLEDVVRVAVGERRACAVVRPDPSERSGEVWCWGRGDVSGLLAEPLAGPDGVVLTGVVDLDATGGRFCALLRGWGRGVLVERGDAGGCSRARSGGRDRGRGRPRLRPGRGRQRLVLGRERRGQLGDGTTTASAVPVRVIGLDGSAATRVSAPDELPYGPRVLAAGEGVTCVLRDHVAGTPRGAVTAWCWGANDRGQLGDGSRDRRSGAVRVTGLDATDGLFDVAVGGSSACVVTGEETRTVGTDPTMGGLIGTNALRCWGGNERGQLGVGDRSDRSTPTLVVMTEEPRLGE